MEIVQGSGDLARFVTQAQEAAPGKPVLIDKYLAGIEVEVDAICSGDEVLIPGIMEHIERAGVHSGDSMAIYPAPNLYPSEVGAIIEYTRQIGVGVGVRGLMNIQYVVMREDPGRDGDVYVNRGQPPREPHGAVPQQGQRRADGRGRGPRHARRGPARAGLSQRPVAGAAAGSPSRRPSSACPSWAVSTPTSAPR